MTPISVAQGLRAQTYEGPVSHVEAITAGSGVMATSPEHDRRHVQGPPMLSLRRYPPLGDCLQRRRVKAGVGTAVQLHCTDSSPG